MTFAGPIGEAGKGVLGLARRYWIPIAIVLVLLVGARLIFGGGKPSDPYRTAAIDRGAITRVVSATGTLQPVISANVGSLVSAPVKDVLVDFNSHVTAGQPLARLDPTTFQQRVVQLQASLAQAQAQAAVANADYQRYERLNQAGFASSQLMSQQRAARDTARAAVQAARAQLAQAQTDLSRTTIRSPINGVVVDRQINVGQVVQASFQAATLFTIAQDLSRLQANISVDEADIGDVHEGQPVRFTVDAFPDSEFDGRVSQVRQQGVDNQGVVSYTVVVEADNPGGRLMPGMTANAEIIIQQIDNALRMPNAALRFRPADPTLVAQGQALVGASGAQSAQSGASGGRRGGGGGFSGGGGGQGGGGQARMQQFAQQLELTPAQQTAFQNAMRQAIMSSGGFNPDADPGARRAAFQHARAAAIAAIEPTLSPRQRQLLTQLRNAPPGQQREVRRQGVAWVLRNNKPSPVRVVLGVADDTNTAIVGGDLHQGDQVITGGGPRSDQNQQQQRGPGFGGPGGIRIRGG